MDPMTMKLSVAEVDSNRDDELAKKEMNMCSISDTQKGADVNEKRTASIAARHDDTSTEGACNIAVTYQIYHQWISHKSDVYCRSRKCEKC